MNTFRIKHILFFIFFIIVSQSSYSQSQERLDEIIKQIESSKLEANNLTEKQKKLLETYQKEKIEYEVKYLKKAKLILDGEIYDYVNGVLKKLMKANSSIPSNTKIVIVKKNQFNAFTFGDNVLFINMSDILE